MIELTPGQTYINSDAGQRYANFVRGMHCAQVDFSDDSEKMKTDDVAKILRDNVSLIEANSVGSRIISSDGHRVRSPSDGIDWHKPVLDLDMDVMVLPSSTRGHHHLYIDKPMPWRDYSLLLKILAHVGILQNGYMFASESRAESFLRTPWTTKT